MLIPTVVIPAERGVTVIGSVKFTVPAVPTDDPSSLIMIPDPDPTTPVNPEPSPTKLVAVTIPVYVALPVLDNVIAVPT